MAEKNQEDIESIKKLPAELRIKKLKELEEKRKKEIDEAIKLEKLTQSEIEEKEKALREIPIPQLKSFDASTLFTREEKEIFQTKRFGNAGQKFDDEEQAKKKTKGISELEEAVWEAPAKKAENEFRIQDMYKSQISQLSRAPAEELYSTAKSMYDKFKESGYLTDNEIKRLGIVNYAMKEKEKAIESGFYKAGVDVEEMFDTARKMMKTLYRY